MIDMRMDTIFKHTFAFEYWVLQVSATGVQSFVKDSDQTGLVLPVVGGDMALITKDQLAIPMQVRNVRDRTGTAMTEVNGAPYPLYVHTAEVQLDAFSEVIGWRHMLRREPPRRYSDMLEAIVASGLPLNAG